MKNKDLPAMPTPYAEITNCMGGKDELYCDNTGLTKREYYAAHAPDMPEFWFNEQEHDGSSYTEFRVRMMCKWRWHYADMMLATNRHQ